MPKVIEAPAATVRVREAHQQAVRARRAMIAELARRHGIKWCLYNFRHNAASRIMPTGVRRAT